ncbi:MAG TPA: ATP-binding protein [Allosphingosinicella sp.]|jgi:signal transduction histidine kinase
MLLLMGAALLVAQLVNFAALLNEQQKLSLAQNEGPAIFRFAQIAATVAEAPPAERAIVLRNQPAGPGMIFRLGRDDVVARAGLTRDREVERRLDGALRDLGRPLGAVRGAVRVEIGGPPPQPGPHRPPFPGPDQRKIVFLSADLGDGTWLNGRLPAPQFDHWLVHRLLVATCFLFLLVFAAVFWIARRLAAPLRDLTAAAEGFDGADGPPVTERGPSDIRAAIAAFNAMRRRTLGLLDEKDRMLGAIGHDLRTPLASIRIRAENMGPEEERERLVATLEEMHATLEDILVLARTGRSAEPARPMDVAALADSIVEELRDLGRLAAFEPSPRTVLAVRPNLLRRALRNLADNAIAYGGGATLRVEDDREAVRLVVEDQGPGIPSERLAEVLEPFRRLETSRNRESGGAGLGLAIAQAVAAAHGGRLELVNREGGGLRAVLILPRG